MKNMTSKQLKEMAKNLKVKNWWKLSKAALIEGIEKAQAECKQQFKERCDECRKADVLQEFEGKLLCNECIEKELENKEDDEFVEAVNELIDNEEVEETPVEEQPKPKKTTSKKAKIKTTYRSNSDLGKDFMYALVTPGEYDINEFLNATNDHLKENDWPIGELVVEDAEETFEVAFAKVKGQSKQQWHAICKAFTQAKKDIVK